MSMKTHACYDYGLYITENDLNEYANKNNLDIGDLIMDIGNYYSDAEGECTAITEDETFSVSDSFCILSLERFPALFEQAYPDKESAMLELKNKYGEYLPDSFDYATKFVYFIGTVSE